MASRRLSVTPLSEPAGMGTVGVFPARAETLTETAGCSGPAVGGGGAGGGGDRADCAARLPAKLAAQEMVARALNIVIGSYASFSLNGYAIFSGKFFIFYGFPGEKT